MTDQWRSRGSNAAIRAYTTEDGTRVEEYYLPVIEELMRSESEVIAARYRELLTGRRTTTKEGVSMITQGLPEWVVF